MKETHMSPARVSLPKSMIPIFVIWILICNVGAIVLSILLYYISPAMLGSNVAVNCGVIIGINVLSMLLLLPLYKLDPVKPFLIPALIWYIIVSLVYGLLGLWIFLIPGTIQLVADLWFHWKLNKIST